MGDYSLGENAPGAYGKQWLCPSGPGFTASELADEDDIPIEVLEAMRAKKERLEAEREAREIKRRHERAEAAEARKAERKRQREEAAKKNKAEYVARKPTRPQASEAEKKAKYLAVLARRRANRAANHPETPEGWLRSFEAADRIGLCREAISRAVRENRLESKRVGRYVYVRIDQVDEYKAKSAENWRESARRAHAAFMEQRRKDGGI